MRHILIDQNLDVIGQGRDLLATMDPTLYATGATASPALGPHLRHCIDFYEALLRDWSSGKIDYDRRDRDPRLETEPLAAVDALDSIRERLEAIPDERLAEPIDVTADAPRPDEPREWTRSSLGRELRFLLSHTVHHYAIVALLLRHRGKDPGADFGVASSTLTHRAHPPCAR